MKSRESRSGSAGAGTLGVSVVMPESGAKPRTSPRVTAPLNVKLAAQTPRGAIILAGTIGNRPRFELSALPRERLSPGELGPARDTASRPPPRAPQRPRAAATEGNPPAATAPSSGGEVASRRREPIAVPRTAPTAGLAGLPGLGVFLGELGSPARRQDRKDASERPAAGSILGRGLRWAPSLADVSVSIGGIMPRGQGMSRLVAPLRMLAGKRQRPAPAKAPAPLVSEPPAMEDAVAAAPPALPETASVAANPSARSRLQHATRYIVNGILDVAIRRFRAAAPSDRA